MCSFIFSICFGYFSYTQCVAMTRFYKQPVLLIEFDPNKSFSLQVNVLFVYIGKLFATQT